MKLVIETAEARTINADLFDDFKAVFPKFISSNRQDYVLWSSARLMLNHPEGPFPDPALELFRDYSRQGVTWQDLPSMACNPKQVHAALTSFFLANLKTAQTLRDAHRDEEARECLDIGRSIVPKYFTGKSLRQIRQDPEAAQWGEKFRDQRRHLERLSRRQEDVLEEFQAARQKRNEIIRGISRSKP